MRSLPRIWPLRSDQQILQRLDVARGLVVEEDDSPSWRTCGAHHHVVIRAGRLLALEHLQVRLIHLHERGIEQLLVHQVDQRQHRLADRIDPGPGDARAQRYILALKLLAHPVDRHAIDELTGDQVRQERCAGVALGQDMRWARSDVHALVAVPAAPLRAHMPLHPHLGRLVVVALADLLTDALHRPAHPLVLAVLLLVGQVVHDLLARQVLGDFLAPAAVSLALVRGDFAGASRMRGIGRLDRGEHLSLVEEQLLLGGHLQGALLG